MTMLQNDEHPVHDIATRKLAAIATHIASVSKPQDLEVGSAAWRDQWEFEIEVGFAPPVDPRYTETRVGPNGQDQHVFITNAMLDLVPPNRTRWEAEANVRVRKNFGITETARTPANREEHIENRKALLKELQRRDSESYGFVSILKLLHEYASGSALRNYEIVTSTCKVVVLSQETRVCGSHTIN